MLQSLDEHCHEMGLSISARKTKTMAVLPDCHWQAPVPVHLNSSNDSVEAISSFSYLCSVLSDDCSLETKVSACISRTSRTFRFLNRLLWYQKKIRSSTKICIFRAVVVPTLLYGLQCAVLLEPHVHHLQSFIMRCLRIILHVSLWDKQCNTTLHKLAKQRRVSSILAECRLRLLGHIAHMDDNRLPKKLLVCAPAGGHRSLRGQRRRWNDLVAKDLTLCELEEDWYDRAQDRHAWQSFVRKSAEKLNLRLEQEEMIRKDERKIRKGKQLEEVAEALRCPTPNCSFIAASAAGLANHQRQIHLFPKFAQCIHCGKIFYHQGIHNHQKSYDSKPND